MVRDKDKLEERSKYFKKVVAKSSRVHKAVKKLAEKYYISERTVYRVIAS